MEPAFDVTRRRQRSKIGEQFLTEVNEQCRLVSFNRQARWTAPSIELMDSQKREILRIYDNPTTTRRAIISVGRKSGKTSLVAARSGVSPTSGQG
jgi:hypothetical protein